MLVDLTLLFNGGPGDMIGVHGVRVGDLAESLDRTHITSADEHAAGERRTWMDGQVYREGPDGCLVEIPLDERIAATLRKGGFLRTSAGAFAVVLDVRTGKSCEVSGVAVARGEPLTVCDGNYGGRRNRFGSAESCQASA